MKKFNRVLAMLLAIIMTVAVLPLSVFADAWLDTKVDTEKDDVTSSTTVTLTLDAALLLNYLKSGDKAALTQGIALDALRDAVSMGDFAEILPMENLESIITDIAEEVDIDLLMKYIDIDELIASANTELLIDQIMELPNLQDYVLDYDALMGYITEKDLAAAIGYVDTDALIEDYTEELIPLALDLEADVLVSLINVDQVLEILENEGIDFTEVLNDSFFGTKLTYNDLLNFDGDDDGDEPDYMDMHGFIDYIHLSYTDDEFAHILHDYVDRQQMKQLLKDHEHDLEPYLNMANLQGMLSGYADVKEYVTVDARLFEMVSAAIEADPDKYIDSEKANDYFESLVESGDIDVDDLGGDVENINYANVFKSSIMTEARYEALINAGALKINALVISADAPLSIQKLNNEGLFDLDTMLNEDDKFNIDALERAEVIDLNKMIFGDEATGLDPFDSDMLISYDVLDMHAMLAGDTNKGLVALFSVTELIRADVIHDDKIVEVYGYSAMIDNVKLKAKINALSNKSVLVDCIPDHAAAIKTIGVKKAVDATCGSYDALINDYVTNVAGMMTALNIAGLIEQINQDEKLDVIFDLTAIVEALGVSNLLDVVDIKIVIAQLSENEYEGLKAIAETIETDTYISALTSVLGIIEKNVKEIKINDTVITKKDGDLLFIDTASFFVLMEDFFPEIEDIANMGDDGKVFSANLSIKYMSDATDGVEKTKSFTFDFVLANGVDQVRTAAQKLKTVLDKFITWDFKDGIFSADLMIPSKFATAIKIALEKLAQTGDEDILELKDTILTLFDLNVSDIGAFVDALTLEQAVALLKLVDSDQFSAAYNKLMASDYVDVLLNYIKEATGEDFTDLTPSDLLIKATDLPTLDTICEKIEEKLGREIPAFDKIPASDPVAILNKLADKAGYDVDLKQILKDAAAKPDPLKYAYDTVVSIIENSTSAYANVKNRVLTLVDKVLASNVADKLKNLSISDFYEGSGVFGYEKTIAIEPAKYLEKGVNKAVELLLSKKDGLDDELVTRVVDIFLSYFTDDTVELGVDLALHTKGLYKVVFYNEVGEKIMTSMLPAGADLTLLKDYESINPEDVFLGWKALTSDTRYEKMPAKDIGVMADVGKLLITVVDPEDDTKLVGIIEASADKSLNNYLSDLNALVKGYLKNSTLEDEEIFWIDYATKADCDMDAVIEKNLYLTWRLEIAHDVILVDPETNEPVWDALNVPDGTTLENRLDEMILAVEKATGKDLDAKEILWINTANNEVFSITTPITSDLKLTWRLEEKVIVNVYDPADTTGDAALTYELAKGDKLNATQIAEMISLAKENNLTLADEDIVWHTLTGVLFDIVNTAIEDDVDLTWSLDLPEEPLMYVTLVDGTDAELAVYVVKKGETLSDAQIADMIARVQAIEGTDINVDDIIWTKAQTREIFAVDSAVVESDLTLSWVMKSDSIAIVTLVDRSNATVTAYVADKGAKLTDAQVADMIEKVKLAENKDALTADAIFWQTADGVAFDPAEDTVDADMTLTWTLGVYTITIVHPDNFNLPIGYVEARSGDTLADLLEEMVAVVNNGIGESYTTDDLIWFYLDGTAVDLDAEITSDLSVYWNVVEYVTVTLLNQANNESTTFPVVRGEKLTADQIDQMLAWIRAQENDDDLQLNDIIFKTLAGDVFAIATTVIDADITLTWEIATQPEESFTITLVDPDDSDRVIHTIDNIAYGTAIEEILAELAALEVVANADPTNIMHVYVLEWREVVDNEAVAFNWTTVTANHVLTWEYVEDHDKAAINVVGADRDTHYEITRDANGNWVIEWIDADWPSVLELNISVAFYKATENDLIVRSKNTVHEFVYSRSILNRVAEFVEANPNLLNETIETVSVHFETNTGADLFDYASESGASYFVIGFYLNGYDETDPNHHEQSIGMFGAEDVKITLPFADASMAGDKVTFVTFAGKDVNGEPLSLEDVALSSFNTEKGSVTFYAPHFSGGAIVNKYAVYHADKPDSSRLPAGFPTDMIPTENIATFPIAADKYYAQGDVFGEKHPWANIDLLGGVKGFYVAAVMAYTGNTVTGTGVELGETFTMPGNAITLQHVIDIQVYYIYYYVNSALNAVDSYTILEALPALRVIPDGYGANWKWNGYIEIDPAVEPQDMYVYLINDVAPDAEKQFTVNFYGADDKLVEAVTKSVAEWAEIWNFPTVASKIPSNATVAGYWVIKDASAEVKLLDLTAAEWNALLSGTELNVYARYTDRAYTIYTDGNASVNTITAVVGTTIQVTIREEIGKKVTVLVNNLADPTNKVAFTFDADSTTTGTFVMPAADVEIEVVYTAEQISYVDADGKNKTAYYGDVITLPAILIPEGSTIDMAAFAKVADDLILVSSSMDENRNLVLVYQYVLVESVNEQELIAAVKKVALNYHLVYVLNGKTFENADAALATLTGSATFKEWCANGKNLNLAALNLASENLAPSFLILCIVLIVLILILVIALLYILYITGKLKPNWFLKAITAIVSAFFVVCMAVAKAGLAIARLFGYQEEDLLETADEINARIGEDEEVVIGPVIHDFEKEAEEATEEVAEEATDESTEEAAEGATEEATEQVAEEATEEVTEEVAEEATEEVTEEAAEEATEEATEEVTEEVAEEATEEVTEEDAATAAAVEEAIAVVVEEATAEDAEEVTAEETTEETTEETSDKTNN